MPEEEKNMLRVIVCRPGERAEVVEIEDDLEAMQDIVGGLIEEWDPFFICYAPVESERFLSLPPDLEEEFRKRYEKPEHIFRIGSEINVVRYDPGQHRAEQER